VEFHRDDRRDSGTISIIIRQHCRTPRQLDDVPLQSLVRLERRIPAGYRL